MIGRIARLYYEHGLTHAEIASMLDVSRIKVTRMLADARRRGIVEITVHSDERPFADLEGALVERFGLQSAWVSPSGADGDRAAASLALSGAEALGALLPRARRVVVGLSRSVAASIAQLRALELPGLEILPLAGSRAGRANGADPHELVTSLAHVTGGTPFHLPAPLIAAGPDAAAAVREDPDTRAVLEVAAAADLLVVGVGGNQRAAQALQRWITESEFEALRGLGAVGDVSARFFDADGNTVPSEVDERVVSLTLDELRTIDVRVAMAGGPEKRDALFTSVARGLVNAVVTDVDSAVHLLERAANDPRRGDGGAKKG
ncbi:sugar-binding transcriptional regulator [Cellulosimicrobium cellulans]|uniref:sugar-binding transcriptional regulator n=1 Tax=Cellulosimicrobium cellulans TaxID=1710 RepID=UPI0036EF9501